MNISEEKQILKESFGNYYKTGCVWNYCASLASLIDGVQNW